VTLTPEQFLERSPYDLLTLAARGLVGVDHRFLQAIVSRPKVAIPDLIRFGTEDHTDSRIDLEEDLCALCRYFDTPQLMPLLIELVRHDPPEIHEDLAATFVRVGEPAIGPLLDLYNELGEEEGGDVAFLLTLLKIRDPRIWHLLREHLEFSAEESVFLFGIYGDPAAIPILEQLKSQAPELESEIQPVIQQLCNPVTEPKPDPIDLWELYPETLGPVFGVLSEEERLEFLSSPSAEYRADAVISFQGGDLDERIARRMLQLARHDPDPNVRVQAWEAVGGANEVPEFRQALLERLNNTSVPVAERVSALLGLAGIEHPAIHDRIEEFYQTPETRARSIEAMARSLDRRYNSVYSRHLGDADVETRRAAIRGIGMAQVHGEANRIREFFDDEEFRLDALFSYALAVPTKLSRGNALALFRKIEEQAGGLSDLEGEVIESALDMRLMRHGLDPVFLKLSDEDSEIPEPVSDAVINSPKIGRNDPCPCGSGKKYKKCCGA
jgi:hypothetical protein